MRKYIPSKVLFFIACLCAPYLLSAQKAVKKPLPNWQNLDLATDGQFGISTEKAYKDLLAGKKHVPVLVAVLDGGVDINHEDLKGIIWTNPGEKADNSADDDKNGYADDLHGWDFIGSAAKGNVQYDNMELTRQLKQNLVKYKYAKLDTLKPAELVKYKEYQKMDLELNKKIEEAQKNLEGITGFKKILDGILKDMGKSDPTFQDWQRYTALTWQVFSVRKAVLENWRDDGGFRDFMEDEIEGPIKQLKEQINYHYNLDFESRDTVGDNYFNSAERNYGNPDVTGPGDNHGTHVSGIIGAVRDNDLGIKGVANDVQIMSVRTVPNGDERDKDVANAIRYAANNGAKVINMSFGKPYSQDKKAVDEAVKFAMSKDVLIVHAAGNENQDNDTTKNFPNRNYEEGGSAAGWIEVGASGFIDDQTLKASFSNYGKTTVDVFAPGVQIKSSVSGSKYKYYGGTSMAAPVVAGLAALIRSYYPKLTAVQVKYIILKSVTKVDRRVELKDNKKEDRTFKLNFADLSQTGGIVNAYEALKLAASY